LNARTWGKKGRVKGTGLGWRKEKGREGEQEGGMVDWEEGKGGTERGYVYRMSSVSETES